MTAPAPAEAYPRGGLRWTLFGRLSMTAANGLLMLGCALFFMDEATFGLFAAVVGAQLLASRAALCGLDQGVVRLFTADPEPDGVIRGAVAITLTLGALGLGLAGLVAAAGGILLSGRSASAGDKEFTASQAESAEASVTFSRDVQPLLQKLCADCHGSKQPKGNLQIDALRHDLAAGATFAAQSRIDGTAHHCRDRDQRDAALGGGEIA